MGTLGALTLALLVSAPAAPTASTGRQLASRIPRRPPSALSGSEFSLRVRSLAGQSRDEVVLGELRRGNLPSFLHELKPVRMSGSDRSGRIHEGVIWVTPDYLAVGSDDDFVRVPMGFDAAVAVARSFGFTLPTGKMVDAIYEQSNLRLAPEPMTPGPQMESTDYFWRHHLSIELQLSGRAPGELTSGHKKDLILTKRLLEPPGRVAIYGWHRRKGLPIQPVSTVHGARYADYSHGVRLVAETVALDGELVSIFDVLRDPDLAPVFSHEGAIADAARLMRHEGKPVP